MFPVALLPLVAGVAWACPNGFSPRSDVCISLVKSRSWKEGQTECARRGGPTAVLVPSQFRLEKVPAKLLLPLWAMHQSLGRNTASEDECHVRPGCAFMTVSCHWLVVDRTSNGSTCYERIRDAYYKGPCSFGIQHNCSSDWRPDEELVCFMYNNIELIPSLSIDYRNDRSYILSSEQHLLGDCWCIMAEFDTIYENKTVKANVISVDITGDNTPIMFPQSKGDFENGAFWCQCVDKWTGLMKTTNVDRMGYARDNEIECKGSYVIPGVKRNWCPFIRPEIVKDLMLSVPSYELDILKELDMAVHSGSNVTVILRELKEQLKFCPLKKGSNISYEGEAISALVLPEAIGIMADNSGLSNVTDGVTAKDLAQNANVTTAVVLRRPQRVTFVVYKNHNTFHDEVVRINSPVVEVFAVDPYVDVVLRPVARVPDRRCAFWDLQTRRWNTSGCTLTVQDQVNDVCHCDHLTTFAQIVMETQMLSAVDEEVLEHVSLVGCGASLLGALGTFLTAALCREWRRRKPTLMLLHLTAAVALRDALFVVAAAAHVGFTSCVCVGVALHYAELSAGAWCLIAGVLQICRFTSLTRGSVDVTHLVLRCVLLAWPAAALPVVTLLGVEGVQAYSAHFPGLCFPRGPSLLWAVTLPLGLATLVNAGVFAFLVWTLCGCSADVRLRAARHGGPGLRTKALKCVMLFFLLGLPWVFGVPSRSRVLVYVFCVTATPQGLVLFLFFVLFNNKLRSTFVSTIRRNLTSCLERLNWTTSATVVL